MIYESYFDRGGVIMKDAFDKKELQETINEFRDFRSKANYSFENYAEQDLILLDKVFDYLLELKEKYE
jgi:hypothetical protein